MVLSSCNLQSKNSSQAIQKSLSLPEVVDRDDNQQVKNYSQQSDAGQQIVYESCLQVRAFDLPAGGVEFGKAEFIFFHGLLYQKECERGAAQFWQLSDQGSLS